MKQKELLRPFDHALADAGEPICWSHLDTPVEYVGILVNGLVAVKTHLFPIIEMPSASALRMLPLFWLEDKPVYKGDRLWHTLVNGYIVVTGLQNTLDAAEKGWFTTSNAFYAASLCKWEKPEPTPLFMLDDKPVFPGTRVWHVLENGFITLKERASNGDFLDTNNVGRSPAFMRWEGKQKHVKFANVYSDGSGVCFGYGYDMEQIAHENRSRNTLAIARVEWETSIKA